MTNRIFSVLGCLIVVSGSMLAADSWPDFRGPFGTGHAEGVHDPESRDIPLHWSETKNLLWKTAVPFLGHSGPVVMENRVWVTTAKEDGREFFVVCLDAGSGKMLRNKKVFVSEDPEPLGNGRGANTYATPSSVVEPGRVFVHFGSFGTACLDTKTFEVLWSRQDLKCRHYRGASSSPLLFDDFLILTFDGADLQYTVALDKRTGKTVWKTDRSVVWNDEHVDKPMVRDGDWRKAHSTPLIVEIDGAPSLFSVGAKAAYLYDPRNGREKWRVEFHNWSAAPRPIFYEGSFIFITGFSRSEMWSVKAGGAGDVTESHVNWKIKNPIPRYSSPILVENLVYFASEESFLSCIESKTGDTVWTERVGGNFRSSPIYAGGLLYFSNLEGETFVIKPGRHFDLLAKNQLADEESDGTKRRPAGFTASPAISGSKLFMRTRDFVYCLQAN
ncbi:MAG: PQQ-binding-like beta-propeller repeat protein [Verrucomicrobia bacterium]|nr:PQQ-binding-like beta-propeller repeat protein [Verrucomicrobiota bacterium]MDA7644940.1 PQQ-binding-like beta-propeller repeat protein [bacterium]